LQGGPEFATWLAGRGHRVRRDLDEPRIEMHDHGDSVEIVLNRPRLHNLMDASMRDQLVTALVAGGAEPDRTILIRANGPSFCGGGDPAEFGTVADTATAHLIRSSANVAPALLAVSERTTVEIQGPAVGAGIELAAFAGCVRATTDATFRLPELQMGLIPGAGGTVSIPARIGRQRTLEWLLSGAELDADTALSWGLVDNLIDAAN
ncbi:MAG: enoyl-CoA hydratase/isomerase family protein, partial [Acidimicrobiales bacterium]